MKRFLNRRFLSLICAFFILVSLVVGSASAALTFDDDFRDSNCVADWNAAMNRPNNLFVNIVAGLRGCPATVQDVFWNLIDPVISFDAGSMNQDDLAALATKYTSVFNRDAGYWFGSQIVEGSKDVLLNSLAMGLFGKSNLTFSVRVDEKFGIYRIYCNELGLFVCDSAGRFPYYYIGDGLGERWVTLSTMVDIHVDKEVVDYDSLKARASYFGLKPIHYGDYWIIKKSGAGTQEWVLANGLGRPYVAHYDKNKTATSTTRPTTSVKDENGDTVEVPENSSANIDLSGMTVTLPDGTFNFIDQLIYDESTKTYYIDSHDTYTTNNNYYVTNNYSWTYYINYTSITYIGQTEEYNKYYEVYYELPDGRDSADLTKEEVEQLNVCVDVIPYGRSADDTSLRSLYHFDGDTRDSSYWNYCTDFTWNKGASLTYMDAGVFDGALYLDETEHDFTLTLPSIIGSGDFTLQFRYYQSYTAAPQSDSYVMVGGFKKIAFNGASLIDGESNVLSAVPIGSWNEIALVRSNGVLYWYLNGVCVGSAASTAAYSGSIQFHFGSAQQTFKYLDELRLLNCAITSGGGNYDCTSVPFDTNLTLILPTDSVAVADEYWSISSSGTNLLASDFSSFLPLADISLDRIHGFGKDDYTLSSYYFRETFGLCDFPEWYYFKEYLTPGVTDSGFSVSWGDSAYSNGIGLQLMTLLSPLAWCGHRSGYDPYNEHNLAAGTYTLSMVAEDGSIASVTFNLSESSLQVSETGYCYSVDFNGYRFGLFIFDCTRNSWLYNYKYLGISPLVKDPGKILYLELVEGDSTDLSAEWIESVTVMDKSDLNTPTLAVRTDLDITSYQIGGVRPSLPQKGQVWCLVENERITSIQIYNGSAWEGVDGRIWTGERWVPASSYNIITLQDMYDIADATQDFEYIYSESGFWTWWQKSWNAFTEKLFGVLGSGGSVGAASGGPGASELQGIDLDAVDPDADPDEESSKSLWQFVVLVISGGKSVVNGTRELFSGVVSTVPDTMDTITGAFAPGGIAVGALDGTSSDPDAADMPNDSDVVVEDGEVLDPWRYR